MALAFTCRHSVVVISLVTKCWFCRCTLLSIALFPSAVSPPRRMFVQRLMGGRSLQFGSSPSLTACDCCVHSWCGASLTEYFSLYTSASALLSVALVAHFHPRTLFNSATVRPVHVLTTYSCPTSMFTHL